MTQAEAREPVPTGISLNARTVMRIVWALGSVFVVQSIVFGLAVLPAVFFWYRYFTWSFSETWIRVLVLSMSFLPAYLIFALSLMGLSALATRLTGWRTEPGVETPVAALEWPLLDWVRYVVSVHFVQFFAGRVFRATPVWTLYMRMNGARLGSGVYVNSLNVADYSLLDFGDNVVIGGDAHVSGHTIENGWLRTATVRLGDNVTIGVGAVIGIGSEIGPNSQVGALAVVPKFSKLEAGGTYVGVPVRRLSEEEGSEAPP